MRIWQQSGVSFPTLFGALVLLLSTQLFLALDTNAFPFSPPTLIIADEEGTSGKEGVILATTSNSASYSSSASDSSSRALRGISAALSATSFSESQTCSQCVSIGGKWCSRQCVRFATSCRGSTFDSQNRCTKLSQSQQDCRSFYKNAVCRSKAQVVSAATRAANTKLDERKKILKRRQREKRKERAQQRQKAVEEELKQNVQMANELLKDAHQSLRGYQENERHKAQSRKQKQASKKLTPKQKQQAEEYVNLLVGSGNNMAHNGELRKIDSRVGNMYKSSPIMTPQKKMQLEKQKRRGGGGIGLPVSEKQFVNGYYKDTPYSYDQHQEAIRARKRAERQKKSKGRRRKRKSQAGGKI